MTTMLRTVFTLSVFVTIASAVDNGNFTRLDVGLWLTRRIYYTFDEVTIGDYDNNPKRLAIYAALAEMESITCIQFKEFHNKNPEQTYDAWLEFYYRYDRRPYDRCSGYNPLPFGRLGGRQKIVVNPDCFRKADVLYLMMRVLGFDNEHKRRDRDKFLSMHWQQVNDKYARHFIYTPVGKEMTMEANDYDYYSITHFDCIRYSVRFPTFTLKLTTMDFYTMGNQLQLSARDKLRVNRAYHCHIKTCGDPPKVANGVLYAIGRNIGDTAIHSCNPGYTRVGSYLSQCLLNGQWSDTNAYCINYSIRQRTIFCSFEPYEKTCNLLGQAAASAKWVQGQGAVPSFGLELLHDSTMGNHLGHYMYLELWNTTKKASDKAVLDIVAPMISDVRDYPLCLSFNYIMDLYDQHGSTAQLWAEVTGMTLGDHQIVWRMTGSQGRMWNKIDLVLKVSHISKLSFVAIRGYDPKTLIALDDILLTPCKLRFGSQGNGQPILGQPLRLDNQKPIRAKPLAATISAVRCDFQNFTSGSVWEFAEDNVNGVKWDYTHVNKTNGYLLANAGIGITGSRAVIRSVLLQEGEMYCIHVRYRLSGYGRLTLMLEPEDLSLNMFSVGDFKIRSPGEYSSYWQKEFLWFNSPSRSRVVLQAFVAESYTRGEVHIQSYSLLHSSLCGGSGEQHIPYVDSGSGDAVLGRI